MYYVIIFFFDKIFIFYIISSEIFFYNRTLQNLKIYKIISIFKKMEENTEILKFNFISSKWYSRI